MDRHAFLNREVIIGSVWVGVGIGFCIGGINSGLFRSGTPGPGLVPIIGGITLSSLGLTVLISAFRSARGKREATERFFPEAGSFRKIIFAILGLSVYALVFEYLGFLLTTLFVMIFLLRFIEPQKWSIVWIIALLTSTSFYLVFRLCLKVPLPGGYLGL